MKKFTLDNIDIFYSDEMERESELEEELDFRAIIDSTLDSFLKFNKKIGELAMLYSEKQGLERIAKALRLILKNTANLSTEILLENTSGDGSSLGYIFSHHGLIFRKLRYNRRLGLCLDTAHAWCAGYRINNKDGLNSLLDQIDREIGIERLKVIHLNDTLDELGSRKDRHFHIGRGKIGEEGFKLVLSHPSLKYLPFILETPKTHEDDDMINLSTIRRIYKDELYQKT